MGNWFKSLQKIGKALMLPIAVLPAAALLLRLGAPDVLDIPFITKGGGAVFDNLPLIFSIGIAVGLSKGGSGAAGLAGGIGYLVLVGALGAIDSGLDMGVLAGIISGLEAGYLYNRFHSWTAAAAAYNCGENGLSRRMDKQQTTTYYDLWLNSETSRYVYRILAVKIIMQN